MELGHLFEYTTRNIFLEKLYTECGRETISRSFPIIQKWAYLWINSLKFYTVCLYCMPSLGSSKDCETKL